MQKKHTLLGLSRGTVFNTLSPETYFSEVLSCLSERLTGERRVPSDL